MRKKDWNKKVRDKYADGDIDTCCESLCLAIVEQSVRDYKKALEVERKYENRDSRRVIRELEVFFKSDWFEQLSRLDGRLLIKNVRKIMFS